MTDRVETAQWVGVSEMQNAEPLTGPGSPDDVRFQALANRDAYLKGQVEAQAQAVKTAVNDPAYADNSVAPASTSWVRGAMSALATAAGFSVSLTTNGYLRLPTWLGGVIFQWGINASTSVGGDMQNVDVTFPIAFPNACFSFAASSGIAVTDLNGNAAYRNNTSTVCYGWPTNTGCMGELYIQAGTSGNLRNVQWIAVGY